MVTSNTSAYIFGWRMWLLSTLMGKWDEIKARIPKIIPLLLATVELRKEKNISLLWIEKDLKDLQWAPLDAPCIFCETYKSDKNLL